MAITRTTSGTGLPSGFPFSLAVQSGTTCFISGMPALDADGRYIAGTLTEEADRAWANILAIAGAAGHSAAAIVFVQIVLADIEDYAAVNAWWREQFPDVAGAPARFTFQAGALPFGAKIEIQAVAADAH
ncbi:RidA family protein [Sciscionella sediminilitoris]|uniref:RidA family protein n=1 Tax=Sciscionella sediminilitoris TaxID=1445613 RepID=UPI0006921FB1|nr:RidA family protein [Sciscionella sp. SE31]